MKKLITIIFLFISVGVFAQSFNNNRHIYNVQTYGAVADGVTDCTTFFQAAINDAYKNKGGIIYVPWGTKGIYLIHGALVNSGGTGIGSPNSQIYIKFETSATGTAGSIPIVLEGEEMPSANVSALGNYTINKGGPIIYSDIAGSGTLPSLLGSDFSASVGNLNLASITIKNLDFRVKANIGASGPTMSAINLSNMAFAEVDHVICELDTSSNLSVSPSAETFGIYMPKVNNGAWSVINNVLVTGYKYGIVLTEHCTGNNINAITCEEAFVFPGAYHSLTFGRLGAYWCKNTLSGPIGSIVAPAGNPSSTRVNIQVLDMEWQPSGTGNWFDKNVVVLDASNNLIGHMNYLMVKRGVGVDNTGYNKSGGTNWQADIIDGTSLTIPAIVSPLILGSGTAGADIKIQSNNVTPHRILWGNAFNSALDDANGRVGAGTTSPVSGFDARGTGGVSFGYAVGASSSSSYAQGMGFYDQSGAEWAQIFGTNTSYSAGIFGGYDLAFYNENTTGKVTIGASSALPVRIVTNGLERFTVTGTGNYNLNTVAGLANQVPMSNGTIIGWQLEPTYRGEGQTTLVAGTKAISVTGVTTSSHVIVTLVSQGGTTTTTSQYEGVCTSGTVTINAVTNAGTNSVNTSDTSIVNYIVTN